MNEKIWRTLAHILYNRNDLVDIIKPFFENLKKENINDKKYYPFLKTFSEYHLGVLCQNEIITGKTFKSLIPNSKEQREFQNQSFSKPVHDDPHYAIEEIISGDKVKELQEMILKKEIKTFNTIRKSFKEVEEMRIPLIQYCIMKNAIECFKFLLVNGYDDPNKTMEEHMIDRYKWDCMATAIYFGNKEIMKILEDKGIEKGKNLQHIEAAILSYRNTIAEEIINEIFEKNESNKEIINNILKKALFTSSKSNNIKGTQLLISKGVNINAIDIL